MIINDYIARGFYPSGIDQFFEPQSEMSAKFAMDEPLETPQTLQEIALTTRQALKDLREKKPVELVSVSYSARVLVGTDTSEASHEQLPRRQIDTHNDNLDNDTV